MTRNSSIICFCVSVIAAAISPSSASATDCSRATGAIETAICADKTLRRSDERFNRGYMNLLDRLDARQREDLIASQRVWLAERDAQCKADPSADVAECVGGMMRRRSDELAKKFSDGFVFGQVRLNAAGQSLMVGHMRLDVARGDPETNMLLLIQGQTVIAESYGPFEIEGRTGDDKGEAVVLSTSNGKFPEQYLIWSSPDQLLRVEGLRPKCLHYEVKRKFSGFELTDQSSPNCDGVVMTWSAEGGLTFERKLRYIPQLPQPSH